MTRRASPLRLEDLPLFAPDDDIALAVCGKNAAQWPSIAGANLDDVSKAAGHAGKAITARVYDRDTLEHHRRVRRTIAGTRSGTRDNAE